jgi:hypothetical protein
MFKDNKCFESSEGNGGSMYSQRKMLLLKQYYIDMKISIREL